MAKLVVAPKCKPEVFISRAFYLLWKACGGTMGMGFLQDNPNATEEDVWLNVQSAGDYSFNTQRENRIYADYVFGRMIKWGVKTQGNKIIFYNRDFDIGYNAFAKVYKTDMEIIEATAKSLDTSVMVCEWEGK